MGGTYSDFLEFDPARGSYFGSLLLPSQARDEVRLKDIELEDHAGYKQR